MKTIAAVIAIDPGSKQSGWVMLNPEGEILDHGYDDNSHIRGVVFARSAVQGATLAIEDVRIHVTVTKTGRAVAVAADDIAQTYRQQGRFEQAFGRPAVYIARAKVRAHFGLPTTASKRALKQVLIERYGGTEKVAIGGKKCPACKGKRWHGREHRPCGHCNETGLISPPGPLRGLNEHERDALAVGVTWLDQQQNETRGC